MVKFDGQASLDFFGGAAPVQAMGKANGKPFYFRARGNKWDFIVADRDPIGAFCGIPGNLTLYAKSAMYGSPGSYAASWMPSEDAFAILKDCVMEYLVGCNIPRASGE